jgi:hypothetical protein
MQLIPTLRRDCWPAGDNAQTIPSDAERHLKASKLDLDANALWAHIGQAIADKVLLAPSGRLRHANVIPETMVPVLPLGGFAGWRWPISIGVMPACLPATDG